jgi:hypothetical protein
MIKDLRIGFSEPWTGTYVEGVKSFWFDDERDFWKWFERTSNILATKYDNVSIKEV